VLHGDVQFEVLPAEVTRTVQLAERDLVGGSRSLVEEDLDLELAGISGVDLGADGEEQGPRQGEAVIYRSTAHIEQASEPPAARRTSPT